MNNRILVTYATRSGSTAEVAAAIGGVLDARGFSVDVRPIMDAPTLDDYAAVVIGSAVRTGSWLPEAVAFVEANRLVLNRVPVALFTVHVHNTGDDPASIARRRAYLYEVRPLINIVGEVFFSGKIDRTKLSTLERLMVRAVKAPIGDFREWDKIRGWAETVLA